MSEPLLVSETAGFSSMDAVATKDVKQRILSGILARHDMERVEHRRGKLEATGITVRIIKEQY
jgi:hypothetical protein